MTTGISSIASYLPGEPIGNENLVETHQFDEAFIRDKLGIHTRHYAGENEFVSDLAIAAVEKLVADQNIDKASIRLLVVITQTPDYCLPNVAALVQAGAGLPTDIAAFDVSLGCSGYVYGLALAQGMMEVQNFDSAILVTAETYSKIISPDDRATSPLFGDAATATLLTRNPVYGLGRSVFGTDGLGAEGLIARGSGVRRDVEEPLFMDGRAIFNFAMKRIPGLIEECLAANELSKEDICAWVFHQASRYMLESIAPRIGLPKDGLLIDLAEVGNTTSSTIPIALEKSILPLSERPKHVMLCGFGVGLSWGAIVLKLDWKA
jgi:3-oxoacyl-[acyl-carrier-protein] synthase III